jgi:hypothetical protein
VLIIMFHRSCSIPKMRFLFHVLDSLIVKYFIGERKRSNGFLKNKKLFFLFIISSHMLVRLKSEITKE